MKRFLCVLLVFLMITPVLAEGIDLASLSFEELRILQTRISQEMTTRPEWKEVPVPPGLYQIGVDIPAGDWCITCDDSCFETHIDYGSGALINGTSAFIKEIPQISLVLCII